MNRTRARPFVISAPSGGGKSSLITELLRRFPGTLNYSISATTRKPRDGERDGVHYYFKTYGEFEAMMEAGELAEYNQVHGNYYGTPRGPLDAMLGFGSSVVLDLDVYGKVNFDRAYPDSVGILIIPPSPEILEQRLRSRGSDDEATIQLRLHNAWDEMAFAGEHGKYEYTVVNDDFNRALEELAAIVKKESGQ